MVEGRPSHVERNCAGKTRRQENRKGTKAFSWCNERDGSEAGRLPEHELNSNTASTRTNPCRLYRQGFRFATARLAQGYHEARAVRDAERDEPGIVQRTPINVAGYH
jgi:hypothetical protein